MAAYFKFNNIKSSDRNIVLKGYTPIFLPELNSTYEEIPGRHGSVEFNDNTRKDIVIEVEIAILGKNRRDILVNARAVEHWLSQKGTLSFWDEPQRFYVGRIVNQIPLERTIGWGNVNLLFRCEPFAYFIRTMAEDVTWYDDVPWTEQITWEKCTGRHEVTGNTTIQVNNRGAFELSPFIRIDGSFDSLAIDGLVINKQLKDDSLYIDNEKEVIYTKDGNNRVSWMPYTSGDFMKLDVGVNDIQISGKNMDFTLMYLSRERW